MIKPFGELADFPLDEHISKKPVFAYNKRTGKTEDTGKRLDYLSWAVCLKLLHENGAESVKYGNYYGQDGHSLFLSRDNLPEVHVYLEIDGDRRDMTYPVIEGTKDITMEKISQSDVHNASQRAFVKCAAVNWGLGLTLWIKEERASLSAPAKDIPMSQRLREKTNIAVKKAGGQSILSNRTGFSENEIRRILKTVEVAESFEEQLDEVIR